jgi:hypothetical protein
MRFVATAIAACLSPHDDPPHPGLKRITSAVAGELVSEHIENPSHPTLSTPRLRPPKSGKAGITATDGDLRADVVLAAVS